ncbi:hypothetical protein KBC70_02845 [Candidatus Woesebacteria bacterium]|nr:hypothetical protein [Candidatus Woesebacteria bacterium]
MSERKPGSTSSVAEGRAFKEEAKRSWREYRQQLERDRLKKLPEGIEYAPVEFDDEDIEMGTQIEPDHRDPEHFEPTSTQQSSEDAEFVGLSAYEVNRRIDHEEMLKQRAILAKEREEAAKKPQVPKKRPRAMTQGEIDFFGIQIKRRRNR